MAQADGPDRAERLALEAYGLLRRVSAPGQTLLQSHLPLVDLHGEEVLMQPSQEVEWSYAACGTLVSLAVVVPDGEWGDATLIGLEGAYRRPP